MIGSIVGVGVANALMRGADGTNDGQKGMGLIMLILIGVVPTAYALNRAPPAGHAEQFISAAQAASKVVEAHGAGYNIIGDPRPAVTDYIHAHKISEGTYPSLAVLVKQISDSVQQYGSVVPARSATSKADITFNWARLT
jgi:PiT family inorganic phosphate transporter